MALIKIYAKPERHDELIKEVSGVVKLIAAAALNVPEVPTAPSGVEMVFVEGIDLAGIDYIIEIIAVKRANQQAIAEEFIRGLNQVFPSKLFSVYFNNIQEKGMASTPRPVKHEEPISMKEAIERSKR